MNISQINWINLLGIFKNGNIGTWINLINLNAVSERSLSVRKYYRPTMHRFRDMTTQNGQQTDGPTSAPMHIWPLTL